MSATETPESGTLPGRFEFVREPSYFGIPTDPAWERFSDVIRSFSADEGIDYSRQDGVGTPDAVDHNRGTEEPSLTIGYDLQRFFTDGSGNALDPSGDGLLRDADNQLQSSHLIVVRQEYSGERVYTVGRGCKVDEVNPTLDPSEANPILMELTYQPAKVRSYRITQPSSGTTLEVVSTSSNDTMDITIEQEGGTSETLTLSGTTAVTGATSFSDIDSAWLTDNPEGDITISDGSGTTFMEIDGGNTYSDDGQPVDGDRGVPNTGTGSHASAIGTSYEHFIGDRFERPSGSAVRARVNSAGWTVANNIETNPQHDTRAPTVDEGNRNASVEADVAGPFVSHESMVDSLTKNQADLVHELSGGTITFKNTVPTTSAERTLENDQAVASYSETFEASGDPAIVISTT